MIVTNIRKFRSGEFETLEYICVLLQHSSMVTFASMSLEG